MLCEGFDSRCDTKWQSLGVVPQQRPSSSMVVIDECTCIKLGGISFSSDHLHNERAIFEYDVCEHIHTYTAASLSDTDGLLKPFPHMPPPC